MVTRTFVKTIATTMCADVTTAEICNETVEVNGKFRSNEALLKAVKSIIDTPELKAVSIVDVQEEKVVYGMTEEEFLKNAKELSKSENEE